MGQLEEFAKESFAKKSFEDTDFILAEAIKLVSRSTMVSMFEKPKFRDMIKALGKKEKALFVQALFELIHGKEKQGFEALLSLLQEKKLGKWTLITVFQTYYRPKKEVFIKPSTTKLVIEKLELDLKYSPTPSWDFYRKYRKSIKEMKAQLSSDLAPSNPAFCGFLMMSLGDGPIL